jgi:hypothetical protein
MTVSDGEAVLLNRDERIIAGGVDEKVMKRNGWTKLKKKGDEKNSRR